MYDWSFTGFPFRVLTPPFLSYCSSVFFLDARTEQWFLVDSPLPIFSIFLTYLLTVWLGPKLMRHFDALDLRNVLIPYNLAMQALSLYMCYEVSSRDLLGPHIGL